MRQIKNYSFKGTLNQSEFPALFIDICKMTQEELKVWAKNMLIAFGYKVIDEDGFLYAKGDLPVVLTAHMDTVHKEPVREYYGYTTEDGKHIISSPQGIGGDDRCGVYMIRTILATTDLRPTIIFCENEEIGGVGSHAFTKSEYIKELNDVKFFIELDRANADDLVFYEDMNESFHEWCEKVTGYKENIGSFSDISYLCPKVGASGVNISCGYYNQHTLDEYVVYEEIETSIAKTIELLNSSEEQERFEYVEDYYDKYSYGYDKYGGYVYNSMGDFMTTMTFQWGTGRQATVSAESKMSCVAQFLMEHPNLCWNDVYDYYEEY